MIHVVKPLLTADGSYTLLHEELNETYHSRHGAVQESRHVFIQNGLAYSAARGMNPVHILEVGYGTALNAWLTLEYARQHQISVYYHAIEPYPLPEEIWSTLNYVAADQSEDFARLHRTPWNVPVQVIEGFELNKTNSTLEEVDLTATRYDVVYFDAFAPDKQPHLWTYPMLRKVADALQMNGIFITYSAKGEVRRSLLKAGLQVEKLAGPPGKRHMLRAIKV
jgi:tRNA U34 5-methylaminomethyl-2-thiouridine-forming methyltransferase MnmC